MSLRVSLPVPHALLQCPAQRPDHSPVTRAGSRLLITALLLPLLLSLLTSCTGAISRSDQSIPAIRATDSSAEPAARTLAGAPLRPAELAPEARARLEANLAAARADFEAQPSEMATIWLGRRLAYLQRYREAIDVFSDGLARFPDSYRLYRHRGHRYISVREFDAAIADLQRARELMPKDVVETEPDGIPNALGIPLSNTQFNVLYHLALAHYLHGNFAAAEAVWRACLRYSVNHDLLVATTDWLYMTLRRMDRREAADAVLAALPAELEVIENDGYLQRLRLYRGEIDVAELFTTDAEDRALTLATQGYGVANWYLYNGEAERAAEIRAQIRATGSWAAFGYIAAEADEYRLR